MPVSVKILSIEPVTHNVRRYVLERPENFRFEPGQATDLSIDEDGFRDKKNPFTFTALNDAPNLEFTIKSYFDHEGVTKHLWDLKPGARLILRDPWGTITYKGPGAFIAGGAGVTPFIAILRDLHRKQKLKDHTLIVSNRTEADIILRKEFEAMPGLKIIWTVTDDPGSKLRHDRIDRNFLQQEIADFSRHFYLCGPDPMVNQLRETLKGLGANPDSVTWEK